MISEDREIGEDVFAAIHLVPKDETVLDIRASNNVNCMMLGVKEVEIDTMVMVDNSPVYKSYILVMGHTDYELRCTNETIDFLVIKRTKNR